MSVHAITAPQPSGVLGDFVDLEYYALILSRERGIDYGKYWLLVDCESGWRHRKDDGSLVMGDSGLAYGLLQFHWSTFYGFAKQYGLDYDIYDPYNQIDLSLRMIRDGYHYHWTCSPF